MSPLKDERKRESNPHLFRGSHRNDLDPGIGLQRGGFIQHDVFTVKMPVQRLHRQIYAVAGAGVPRPGLIFGGSGLITSGSGVAACAPVGGVTSGVGGGGVNLPVRMISSTWTPSSVSYSSRQLAIISSLSRLLSMISLARRYASSIKRLTSVSMSWAVCSL